MTSDDIRKLLNSCDLRTDIWSLPLEYLVRELWTFTQEDLERFAALVAEREREACAKECLEQIDKIKDGLEEDNQAEQALGADWAGLAVARHFGVE